MHTIAPQQWIPISPNFGRFRNARTALVQHVRALQRWHRGDRSEAAFLRIRETFTSFENKTRREIWPLLRASGLLLSDLVEQGWDIKITSGTIHVSPPILNGGNNEVEKSIIRQQELIKRNAQLSTPSVRAFINDMEKKRLFKKEFVSIFNVMRDGRALAKDLRYVAKHSTNGNGHQLYEVIQPYIQFVDKHERCTFTGLRLMDIWRYFRHTWTNQYTSVPGRTMMMLVRDAAAPYHPVIGIAALSSPIIQLSERDKWIGWHPERFVTELTNNPTEDRAKWLVSIVNRALREIYVDDFLKNEILCKQDLQSPTRRLIKKLHGLCVKERNYHNRFTDRKAYEQLKRIKPTTRGIWKTKAETHLFRSKRAKALANYLDARRVLKQFLGKRPNAEKLSRLLDTSKGREIVRKIIRKAKADQVGIAMADLTVCGSIPPYNAILGGKLVSMMMTSPEVVKAYRHRYRGAISEIASSMAGRPIRRPTDLVYLGTTSLYGGNSSQYNRIKIPVSALNGSSQEALRYIRLGKSEAFGTSHYSQDTIAALVSLVTQRTGGQRVNSIFGEGSSPKLRKVREGLETLCDAPDLFLQHGRQRIIYGIPLIKNLQAFLLGEQSLPRFIIPLTTPRATQKIGEWWATRWLRMRIQLNTAIQTVAQHTFIEPINHGARVILPPKPARKPDDLPETIRR